MFTGAMSDSIRTIRHGTFRWKSAGGVVVP
jgi:hypothetical protein